MDEIPKSRTQKKKEDRALQKTGEYFVSLSPEELRHLDLPEEFIEAVLLAREITKHGARRRQMQRIGVLMRDIDDETIQKALSDIKLHGDRKNYSLKKAESWCEALKTGNMHLIDEILDQYPKSERQRLSQLARNAHKENQDGEGQRSAKMLYSYLAKIVADN